jgi:hypothetical protein
VARRQPGAAYTFAEYEAMFLASGFGHSQLLPLGRAAQQLVLTTGRMMAPGHFKPPSG